MFSIIIVTWNNIQSCKKCVESIRGKSHYKDHQIIVMHNEYKITHGAIDGAENVVSPINVGLSKGANDASKMAMRNFICLIDDDIEVTDGWDLALFNAHIKTGSKWVASTRIEPIPFKTNIKTGSGEKPTEWYRNISNTPLLFPTWFWREIGGYDEDFPTIGAELGLARKAYEHGERDFVQTPESVVYHKQSQSTRRLKNIKAARESRDRIFREKYHMGRKEFTKLIGKGEIL